MGLQAWIHSACGCSPVRGALAFQGSGSHVKRSALERPGCLPFLVPQIGGSFLGWWIVVAAAVSQIGQFEAEMCSDSFQLHGMAERGFLPAVFARRSRHGTPTLAIIASAAGVVTMARCVQMRA